MAAKKGAAVPPPQKVEIPVDWANREYVISTMPAYAQARFNAKKGATNAINLEAISLKKPMSQDYLLYMTPLVIEGRRRTCLVGDPGSGKSTLFEAIASKDLKEFPQHVNVWHCKEIEHGPHAESVIDTVVNSHHFMVKLWAAQKAIKAELEKAEGARREALVDSLDWVNMNLSPLSADTAYERAGKMLRVLGFDEEGQKKSTNDLSGGLRMRVALCAAFFVEADLLLLDEPTNHLDFPSVLWLENRLRGYSGSFLLISHDRELLENTVTSIIEIEEKQLKVYNTDFKAFERQKKISDEKKEKVIEKFMALNRNVDFSSPLAKEKAEKQKWLDNYERKKVMLAGKFTFPPPTPLKAVANPEPAPEGETSLCNVKDVVFSYNMNVEEPFYIFKTPINYNITTATRMGVMGPNGAGKSTFLKLVTNRLKPVEGSVVAHPTASVAYFAQHHIMDLDLTKTPSEYMTENFPEEKSGNLKSHLKKVGIVGNQADTRMNMLSHGQRSCILFAKITYVCPDLLIMDEPTNFLDMESVDALVAATRKFQGALLLVSHNRGFLHGAVNSYLSIVPGRFEVFDNLKDCERATYQFIEEMEGGGGLKAGANAMTNTLTKQKAEEDDGAFVIGGGKPAPKPVAKPVVVEKKEEAAPVAAPAGPPAKRVCDASLIGQTCRAVYKVDGRMYPATIVKVFPETNEVTVDYTGYNEKAIVKFSACVFGAVQSNKKPAAAAPAKGGAQANKGAPQKAGQAKPAGKAR